MALIPGSQLDGYEILGPLGSGGMGDVYRARDPILKREVAIKVLPTSVARDADRLRRFEQEAQAAAALNHPNILAIHRFGVFEGAPYLVSELLEGSTLRQVEERGPLAVRKAIDIGVQIANGLAAAHEKGIVHRDLKPENLFVTRDGRVKILDFGLAKLTQAASSPTTDAPTQAAGTEPGMVLGTVGYMAPEQVRGLPSDHRADIFAFGAVLYEMLSGKRAFQRSTSADTMAAILNEDPATISQIAQSTPPGLQRVVQRCLEKNPEQRFQSASDLAFALEALSQSGISSSFPVVESVRTPKSLWMGFASVIAVVVILGVTGFFYWHRPSRPPHAAPPISYKQLTFLGNAFDPVLSPDGKSVAYIVRNPGDETKLMLQDLSGGPSIELVHGTNVGYQKWSPDGSQLMFLDTDSKNFGLSTVSRLGGTPRRRAFGAYSCWLPGGNDVVTAVQNPEVPIARTNLITGAVQDIHSPKYTWLMDLSCSAKTGLILLLTQTGGKSQIWSMKPDGSEQHMLLEEINGVELLSPRWSSNDEAIYFLRREEDATSLVKLEIGSRQIQPSVLLSGLETGESFSLPEDGSQLLYTRQQSSSNLWLIEPHGAGSSASPRGSALTSGTKSYNDPAVSPDSKSIAFTIGSETRSNIYKMELGGSEPIALTSFEAAASYSPAWSPDGQRLAFISDQGGSSRVWIVSAEGGDAWPLEKTDASDSNNSISWLGDFGIVYPTKELHNLRRLNPETQAETPLFPHNFEGWFVHSPSMSPDQKQIAVHLNKPPNQGAWIVHMNDLSTSLLYAKANPVGWSADGNSIYAITQSEPNKVVQINLATKKAKPVFSVPGSLGESTTVSPDGRKIIAPVTEIKSDIWVIRNFDPQATPVQ